MRCNVTLQNQSGGVLFPFNYNHILTSVIYNNLLVAGIDLDFHDSKDFKFFTFSNIIFSKFELTKNGINSIDGTIKRKYRRLLQCSGRFLRYLYFVKAE